MVGVTFCVPPATAKVNLLLSLLSEITTCVALLAVTASIEEFPWVMVAGLATTETVGAVGGGGVAAAGLPQEARVAIAPNESRSVAEHKVADTFRMMARSRTCKHPCLIH